MNTKARTTCAKCGAEFYSDGYTFCPKCDSDQFADYPQKCRVLSMRLEEQIKKAKDELLKCPAQ